MTNKIYSAVCKCWNVFFCTCKEAMNFKLSEPYENTIDYWKRIEHIDQYYKKRS